MYQGADDESREWDGFLLTLHEIFYGDSFNVAEIVEKVNGKTAIPAFGSEPTAYAKQLKAALPGYLG
jgi:hypothetical protein